MDILVAYFFNCQMKQQQLHMGVSCYQFLTTEYNITDIWKRAYEELSNNAFLLQPHVSLVP